MNHVFGPVPSRRLGRSLGIDLAPFKTCAYDCIYCQLGRTTCKIVERRRWLTWEPLIVELTQCLDTRPDYITLSGSGETTLHAGLDELIDRIKSITSIPVAVLTNGSLLWREDVRRELRRADLVIPSLDAGDDRLFRHINRPHETLSFEQMLEGLIAFRQTFKGQYWLEVFLLAGYTSVLAEVERIAGLVTRIRPDRVQLNTVARPPVELYAERVPREQLVRLAELFEPHAEVVTDYAHSPRGKLTSVAADRILDLLRRRPCTIEDILAADGLHRTEAIKELDELTRRGVIQCVPTQTGCYYRASRTIEQTDAGDALKERIT